MKEDTRGTVMLYGWCCDSPVSIRYSESFYAMPYRRSSTGMVQRGNSNGAIGRARIGFAEINILAAKFGAVFIFGICR
jgi:hypothetical protein